MMQKPEMLAPVGSWDSLLAAIENGADAVYLGGQAFNARQYAQNFTREKLEEAVRTAHLRRVKVLVTVNTLIADGEMEELVPYLSYLYQLGVDGIIVQDLGVAHLVRELFPALPLHASTQMTVHNLEGARFLEGLGFTRVIPARELCLEEIRRLVEGTSLEVEVFVHGALCICYSGQCLMSSLIWGRSGNRGRCAQPCRLEYSRVRGDEPGRGEEVREGHLLSTRDLR